MQYLLGFAQVGPLPPAAAMAVQTVAFLAAACGVVGQFAQLSYLQKLALRIPDPDLSSRARTLMWGFGCSYGLLVLAGFALAILAYSGGFPGSGGALGLGCAAGIVLLALLVFGVMYLFMLGGFSRQLALQASLARLAWQNASAETATIQSPGSS